MNERDELLVYALRKTMLMMEPIVMNQAEQNHAKTVNYLCRIAVAYARTMARCYLRSDIPGDRIFGRQLMDVAEETEEAGYQ